MGSCCFQCWQKCLKCFKKLLKYCPKCQKCCRTLCQCRQQCQQCQQCCQKLYKSSHPPQLQSQHGSQFNRKQPQKKLSQSQEYKSQYKEPYLYQKEENYQKQQSYQNQRYANCCYLISAVNFLQAHTEVMIELSKEKISTYPSANFMIQHYKSRNNLSRKQISGHMNKIMDDLKEKNLITEPNRQEDSLMFICDLLSDLSKVNQSLATIIKISYSLRCKCPRDKNFIQTYLGDEKNCSDCSYKEKIILRQPYQYLIVKSNSQVSQFIKYRLEQGKEETYRCMAFIKYYGNKHSGHYMAFKKEQNKKWLQYDDFSVSKVSTPVFPQQQYLTLFQRLSEKEM